MNQSIDVTQTTKRPVVSMCRNLVFGRGNDDVYAVYLLQLDRPACPAGAEPSWLSAPIDVGMLTRSIQTDFSVLRIERPWSVDNYAIGVEAVADVRYVRREPLSRCLEAQRPALEGLGAHTVDVFLYVQLPPGAQSASDHPQLEWLQATEATIFRQVLGCVRARRVASGELAWLIRHAFTRGLPHRAVDMPPAPRADLGPACHTEDATHIEPVPVRAQVAVEGQSLRIPSQRGESHQSFLQVQMLPSFAGAPHVWARGLFDLVQSVDFPVDAALNVRRLGESRVLAVLHGEGVPRRLGISSHDSSTARAVLSLCVSAPTAAELERRVVRLRRALAGVRLQRSATDQLGLFVRHLPVGEAAAAGHELALERLARTPIGSSAIGSGAGPYVGHIRAGLPRPVLFNARESTGTGGSAATLLSGAARCGKTLCMQLIMYHAFMVGSVVIDVDPRGDHALERLPDTADHVDVLELSASRRFRGLLDPLRVGPVDIREQLACDFLAGILPEPAAPEWKREIEIAVHVVARRGSRTCAEVLDELDRGGPHASAAAREIRRWAHVGLAGLGFAQPGLWPRDPGSEQITSLRVRDLRLPAPDVDPATVPHEERVGTMIHRLLVAYALHLALEHEERHCVLGIDDATPLLGEVAGRELIDRLLTGGRTGNFTPLIATRAVGDATWLRDRIGAAFCFRVDSEPQARNVAAILDGGVDADAVAHELLTAGPGRCLMRDYQGRVHPVQIDFADDRLLPILDTTPTTPVPAALG
jgi:hypothetical protein